MNKFQLLIVAPKGCSPSVLSYWDEYLLEFQYVDTYPSDGLSAWRRSRGRDRELIDVADTSRYFNGGFTQHALNRFFCEALLRTKPRVVVICELMGCTADLSRIAKLLEVPILLLASEPSEDWEALDDFAKVWVGESLKSFDHIVCSAASMVQFRRLCSVAEDQWADPENLTEIVENILQRGPVRTRYDYSLYAFSQRDHPLLMKMHRGDVAHFRKCSTVLDVGCGSGIFLDCLRQEGIKATGVERDPRMVEYARGMGLDVVASDALDYLGQVEPQFEGIYCAHFIEHLSIEAVQRVLDLMARRIAKDGVLVLVFPDPESIRSQLLGFWRDPEHVRFYHPSLITLMASAAGFELEWSSYGEQGHRVVTFPESPEPIVQPPKMSILTFESLDESRSIWERCWATLGFVTRRRMHRLEAQLKEWSESLDRHAQQTLRVSQQLEERTNRLWDVNQTWSWSDNVTLRFRRFVDV